MCVTDLRAVRHADENLVLQQVSFFFSFIHIVLNAMQIVKAALQ